MTFNEAKQVILKSLSEGTLSVGFYVKEQLGKGDEKVDLQMTVSHKNVGEKTKKKSKYGVTINIKALVHAVLKEAEENKRKIRIKETNDSVILLADLDGENYATLVAPKEDKNA